MIKIRKALFKIKKRLFERYYGQVYKTRGIVELLQYYSYNNFDKIDKIYQGYEVSTDYNQIFGGKMNKFLLNEMTKYSKDVWLGQITKGRIATNWGNSIAVFNQKSLLINELSFTYSKNSQGYYHHSHACNNHFYSNLKITKPLYLKGNVVSLWTGGGRNFNYYHWFADSLSRLQIINERIHSDNIDYYLVPAYDQHYQIESLKALNIRAEQIISSLDYPHITADTLIVCSHPRSATYHIAPRTAKFLHELFQSRQNKIKKSNDKYKRIYISRSDAPRRSLLNEADLIDQLNQYGITPIKISDYTFNEVIEIFRQAEIVISPHSAALTNIIFCEVGTHVLELFSSDFVIPYYYELATGLELIYWYSLGHSSTSTLVKSRYDGQERDIIADIKDVSQKVEMLLSLIEKRKSNV